ncbi:MarR family winged helix-turn-helix transcriptional regulator [Companilactobacillus kimchiensis]|uniref:HTH marR-type domain-containing protein n=1 Tax=Companilactobacillus kimchiensis TaxID=993692 RepID=A0A0R2LFW9_9LACO|nr:MarR family winged helix-turn-helix transcriptional regulator [Companilactobacillus kimchiensis]KRO00773.1 hypothetical protein IV57_GL000093 [Companilactobacillus kimchiensis]
MEIEQMDLEMLLNKIFRFKQVNLDKLLKPYQITSGLWPYLAVLQASSNMTQSNLTLELRNDRAMTARSIAKLKQLNYVTGEPASHNKHMQYLRLTSKAETIMPEIRQVVDNAMLEMTRGISETDLQITQQTLQQILFNLTKDKTIE